MVGVLVPGVPAPSVEAKHNDIPWLYSLAGLSAPLSQGQENCFFLLHFE